MAGPRALAAYARRALRAGLLALACFAVVSGVLRLRAAARGDFPLALTLIESGAGKYFFYAAIFVALQALVAPSVLRRLVTLRTREVLANAGLVLASLVVGVVLVELALRPFGVVFSAANRVVEARISDDGRRMVWAKPHPTLGFVPDAGRGPHGELPTPHAPTKPAGVTRVLFLGDSIAQLRYLEQAIAKTLPAPERYQFWNTGVSGYSTVQERIFFELQGRRLKPDVVVLEFCLNDFDGTPVVLKDEKEGFVVLIPQMGQDEYVPWLFVNSTLYRFYLTLKKSLYIDPRGRPGRVADMRANLARFQAMAREDGFRFVVVVYPMLERSEHWTENDRLHYRAIRRILDELKIEWFDLGPVLDRALERHPVAWARMFEPDKIHPSREFAGMAAQHLMARGLLP